VTAESAAEIVQHSSRVESAISRFGDRLVLVQFVDPPFHMMALRGVSTLQTVPVRVPLTVRLLHDRRTGRNARSVRRLLGSGDSVEFYLYNS